MTLKKYMGERYKKVRKLEQTLFKNCMVLPNSFLFIRASAPTIMCAGAYKFAKRSYSI